MSADPHGGHEHEETSDHGHDHNEDHNAPQSDSLDNIVLAGASFILGATLEYIMPGSSLLKHFVRATAGGFIAYPLGGLLFEKDKSFSNLYKGAPAVATGTFAGSYGMGLLQNYF